MTLWEIILENVKDNKNLVETEVMLQQLQAQDLRKTDEAGFDILHYGIINKSNEVVRLLASKPQFQYPYVPAKFPYVHLMCWVNAASQLNLFIDDNVATNIFQHRIDLEDLKLWNEQLNSTCRNFIKSFPKRGDVSPYHNFNKAETYKEQLTILDVAAMQGSFKCVETLIILYWHYKPLSNFIQSTVSLDSYYAARFLLQQDVTTDDHCDSAFKLALLNKQPSFLDLLLSSRKIRVGDVLHSMNPYHVLFLYSSSFQPYSERYVGLTQCVCVLQDHGFPINVSTLPGAYPLYSLIYSLIEEYDTDPDAEHTYHYTALDLLLQGGADPNFDEVAVQKCKCCSAGDDILLNQSAFGRDVYRSALHTFFGSLQKTTRWPRVSDLSYLTQVLTLLLDNNARLSHSTLNDLMYTWCVHHSQHAFYLDLTSLLNVLLLHGANPDGFKSEDVEDMFYYPVTIYFKTLFSMMQSSMDFVKLNVNGSMSRTLSIFDYMEHRHAVSALQQITLIAKAYDNKFSSDWRFPPQISDTVQRLICGHFSQAKSLTNMCRLVIWRSIGRRKQSLDQLGLPRKLSDSVVSLFATHKDCCDN